MGLLGQTLHGGLTSCQHGIASLSFQTVSGHHPLILHYLLTHQKHQALEQSTVHVGSMGHGRKSLRMMPTPFNGRSSFRYMQLVVSGAMNGQVK